MRISTQQIFDGGAARMGDVQTALDKLRQQVATGRRMLSPSDDPVAAARALEIAQSQSINAQYADNRIQVRNSLGLVDGALAGVTDLLQDVRSAVVSADNPTFTDSSRTALATELSARFQGLLNLANATDGTGNYLFSGFQSDTRPFVETATGASYHGDTGQQLVQVDTSRRMAMSNSGQSIFQGGGQDIFQTLKDLIGLLQTPVATPAAQTALASGLAAGLSDIDRAMTNISTVRASVGTRMQEVESLDHAGSSRNIQYSAALSDIQDLDYTQALTQLSLQQTALEAAQQSFVKTANLSLFNYL